MSSWGRAKRALRKTWQWTTLATELSYGNASLFVSGSPFCGVFTREGRFPVEPHSSIHNDRNVAARSKRAEEWLSASGTIAVAANHPAFAAKVTGGSHYERVIQERRRKEPR
jgi:hypothetical protein